MKLENLTLPQLILLWGSLDSEVNRIAELIKVQVLDLKQTQTIGDIRATYGTGKGSYDYQKITRGMEAEHKATFGAFLAMHTTPTTIIDWKAIYKDLEKCLDVEGKQKLYALQKDNFTPGKEQVRLSIIKAKEPKSTEDK